MKKKNLNKLKFDNRIIKFDNKMESVDKKTRTHHVAL